MEKQITKSFYAASVTAIRTDGALAWRYVDRQLWLSPDGLYGVLDGLGSRGDVAAAASRNFLYQEYALSVSRRECAGQCEVRLVLASVAGTLGVASVNISFATTPAALGFLGALDEAWPGLPKLDYCACRAALLSTMPLQKPPTKFDRSTWPEARLTLVEWDPKKGKNKLQNIKTDIVATPDLYVFHLSGKHIPIVIRRSDCSAAPVPLRHPFVGAKLHVTASNYRYAKIEIDNAADLPAFANTLLLPWGECVREKRRHSGGGGGGGRVSPTSGFFPMAGGGDADLPEGTELPLPSKRARLQCDDLLRLSDFSLDFPAVRAKRTLTLTNVDESAAVFNITCQRGEAHTGAFVFSSTHGVLAPGRSLSIQITRVIATPYAFNVSISYARASHDAAQVAEPERKVFEPVATDFLMCMAL